VIVPVLRSSLYLHAPLQINGTFKVGGDGSVEFKEEDGIDYAPVTVQLPGLCMGFLSCRGWLPCCGF
jgi:hypothetical protein